MVRSQSGKDDGTRRGIGGRRVETKSEESVKAEELEVPKPKAEIIQPDMEKLSRVPKSTILEEAGLEPYDPSVSGPLAEFDGVEGFEEIERYWIDEPFAFGVILRSKAGDYRYQLVEPDLSGFEETVLDEMWEALKDSLPYETRGEREEMFVKKFADLVKEFEITDQKLTYKLLYRLMRDSFGYGKIDPLMKDGLIEDISCDGADTPVFIYHREYYNAKTNLIFGTEELDSFVFSLAEKCGKSISHANPIMEATLPDGSRIQATLSSEVTTKGSTFSIRRFIGRTFTPVDLIRYGTFSPEVLAFLWLAAEHGKSILVIGGTASGKTSTLNALAFFIPPDAKIVSIEDTRELMLYQENWVPNLTREAPGVEPIDMHELVRVTVRQRPECVIVGEVRGAEALAMFQAIATGQTAFSTMHAGSVQSMVNRLLGEPINLPRPMLAELDIVCLQLLTRLGRERVRRNERVAEIMGLDPISGDIEMRDIYSWDRSTDSFKRVEESQILKEIGEELGLSQAEMEKELANRKSVLRYSAETRTSSYSEVSSLIRQYHSDSQEVLKEIKPEGWGGIITKMDKHLKWLSEAEIPGLEVSPVEEIAEAPEEEPSSSEEFKEAEEIPGSEQATEEIEEKSSDKAREG